MAMRAIVGAGAISEFVSGYTGDCGQCAELCLLHLINAARYPLDAAALSAIVQRDIAQGWASANGAEPLSSIGRDLVTCGESFTDLGFGQPAPFNLAAELDTHGGINPLILELALGGNLPGDELPVHYHFITCVGWDSDLHEGIFADGDNAAVRVSHNVGPAGLVRYTLAQLEAAQVCGLLIGDYTPPPPPPAPAPAPTPSARGGMAAYTVVSGDTLSSIAARLHLSNWYHDLYQPNMQVIEEAARQYGRPSSNGGNLIFPGTVLHYQAA